MSINFLIVFLSYFLIVFSVVGYGNLFYYIFLDKKIILNYGYLGLFGIFFLIIISYLSHFLFSHGFMHNLIIIITGLISFIIFFNKKLKSIILTLAVFFILAISLVILKTHDDFPYYHFGYTWYLIENPLLVGIGQFNHGFRTVSSIFYLNSIFYLPFTNFYFFHLPAVLIMGFTNIIFLDYLITNIRNNKINFISYFILLSLIIINIFFSRIAEHGSDRSAMILVFLFLFEIFILFQLKYFNNLNLSKILIFLGIIVSLKAFYIFYFVILLPVLFFLIKKTNFKNSMLIFLKDRVFYLFIFLLLIIFTITFFNTGCFLYPVKFTCISSVDWSISQTEVSRMSSWYELWSKSGASPNFRIEDPEKYISNFNWVSRWVENYFFNKVSDFIFGIIFAIIFVCVVFFSKKRKFFFINRYIYFLILSLVFIFLEWFIVHPALRYGGYSIIAAIVFIPTSFLLDTFLNTKKQLKNKYITLIIVIFTVFLTRNIFRINEEIQKYQFKPFSNFSFRVDKGHYTIPDLLECLVDGYENNNSDKTICNIKIKPKVGKFLGTHKFYRIDIE